MVTGSIILWKTNSSKYKIGDLNLGIFAIPLHYTFQLLNV